METFQNKSFENTAVPLEGADFQSCFFRNCTLVYGGGPVPAFSDCNFEGCGWQFSGAAGRTVAFARAVAQAMGSDGRKLIENLFLQPGPLDRAKEVLDDGRSRFLASATDRGLDVRPLGLHEAAVVIDGEVPAHVASESFLEKLFRQKPHHTGWPPWSDCRAHPEEANRPGVHHGAWEALVVGSKIPHLEFWRIDPLGVFYLVRALEDDLSDYDRRPKPRTQLDFLLQISRVAEIMSVAHSFSQSIGCDPSRTSLAFAFRWSKLKGRHLTSWVQPGRSFQSRGAAHQDEVVSAVLVPLDTPRSALVPYVQAALRDVFALFGGMEFSTRVFEDILSEALRDRSYAK